MSTTIQVLVTQKNQLADSIVGLSLVALDRTPLPAFSAGAHIDVHMPDGLVRQYSLCNAPTDDSRYCIGVLKDVNSRGGSTYVHDNVKAGDMLQIGLPRNSFQLLAAQHVILVAGGIGITPLLSMAKHLAATGASFELHAFNRSMSKTAFLDELRTFGEKFFLHLDDGEYKQKRDLASAFKEVPEGSRVYVCGPTGFISHVKNLAQESGLPSGNVHVEYFSAEKLVASAEDSFSVKIASTGVVYRIPADESVVTALSSHGIEIATSCGQGICGTCLTGVLEGECDHRDMYLTDMEKMESKQFLPCCSRAKSPMLVLDL